MEHRYDYLIVGGGMAADACVKALRAADATARIGLIGAETHAPYERPPLSKALWKDKTPDQIDLGTVRSGVELHLGRRAATIERDAHVVVDERGDRYRYRRLLLATGATPRTLPFGGERVIAFRTLDDYQTLRRFAQPGASIAVVGGGFIGSELAAALTGVGCRVTLVFPGDTIGAGRLPPRLAAWLTDVYRERGVDVRAGVRVLGGSAARDGVVLELSDGSRIEAAAVAAGLGVTPNVELAQRAGLAVDNGVVVDAHLRSSDPDIFAAGDVANFSYPQLGQRLRVEHENAAIAMGQAAGRAMAGDTAPYATLPFFYSDLFEFGYEAVGLLDDRLDVVEQWTELYREGVCYYLDAGRVRGVLLWNTWGQVEAARDLIAAPGPFDADNVRGRLPRMA